MPPAALTSLGRLGGRPRESSVGGRWRQSSAGGRPRESWVGGRLRQSSAGIRRLVPGLAVVGVVTVLATLVGRVVPVVGGPVFAIVLGLAVATARAPSSRLRPGVRFASRRVLQGSIVVLGLDLSLRQVLSAGARSLPVLVGTLVLALAAAPLVGRRLRLDRDVTTLIGVGTAVCGASAIAATEAVIGADDADVAYAITTIFAFNVVAVLSYPLLGHLMHMKQSSFGLWAGTAINDTSSVVAASTVFGKTAAAYGVVVKLTRTLAIVPICFGLAAWRARRGGAPAPRPTVRLGRVVPLFVLGFLAAVLLDTAGLVPPTWHPGLSTLAGWMITAALAGVGLSARLGDIRRAGVRPLLLGLVLWMVVGSASLTLQSVTGTL